MSNLSISKVLTNNGITIAYELSNGEQLSLGDAINMARQGDLQNVTPTIDEYGHEILVGTSDDNFSLGIVPFENINRPSD